MIIHENNCVDCPQGCINCGNKNQATYYCDSCDDEIDDQGSFYLDGEYMCYYCAQQYIKDNVDDFVDEFLENYEKAEEE